MKMGGRHWFSLEGWGKEIRKLEVEQVMQVTHHSGDEEYSDHENIAKEASSDVAGECENESGLVLRSEGDIASNEKNETIDLVSGSVPELHQEMVL